MKNLKGLICNGLTLVMAALTLVFFGQSFVAAKQGSGSNSGYFFMDHVGEKGMPKTLNTTGVGVILTIVVLCLVMLAAIVGILCNLEVIKNEKVANILRFVNLGLVALLVATTLVYFIGDMQYMADMNKVIDVAKVGWAVIVNLILAVGMAATMALTALKKKA